MVSRSIPPWTLIGLIRSFLDLAVACFLLCGSTLGFFAWKIFHAVGRHLSCPCSGFFGYQNSNLCWHKFLIQWPRRKICSVHKLALNRFPFNLNDQEWNSDAKSITDGRFGNGVIELEGEARSSSPSGSRLQKMVNKKSGYDAKGKKIINQKQKSKIQRVRVAALGYGKSPSVSLSVNFPSAVADASCSSSVNGGETISKNLGLVNEIEDSFHDDKNTQTGTDMDDATWHGFELSNGDEKASTFIKKSGCNTNGRLGVTGDEANRIRILEQALEEEKAARAALYLELEKERAAAASAADEAMAMISRLQEDKASIEMEARQYQRMIEEKFAYDEEEMNVLKEILVAREKDNHLLEKEVEAYRQMNAPGQMPSVSLGLDEDPLLMGNSGSTRKNEVRKGYSWPSKFETPSAEKLGHTAKTAQNFGDTSLSVEELEKNAKFGEPPGGNLHNSTFDMEPAIYDVHVVDDDKDIPKESRKRSKLPTDSASDHKTLIGRSSSAVSNERLEIDAEMEHLRERLRIVREEKEKLTFSADQRERIDTQLKLIEEQLNQVREFQQLKEPVQQTS